ncbi:MAG: hypothetical protein GY859_40440 [Desulfobacterales bacterium]|nr:hypothetical protein [Desulfobacterales bacterium]
MKNDRIEMKILGKDKIEVVNSGIEDNERDIASAICCWGSLGLLRG